MISLIAFCLFAGLGLMSLLINRDVFSPSKFYVFYLFVYFSDIYFNKQYNEVYFVYIYYVLLGYIITLFEAIYLSETKNTRIVKSDCLSNESVVLFFIWVITLIPVVTQVYLIYSFGGIISYLNSIHLRVVEWQGMGPFLALKRFMPILNIIFLYLGLKFHIRNKRVWWILFAIHFILLVAMGLLSGSRGATLFGFVYFLVLINFFHRKISVSKVLMYASILLVTAATLGTVRNSFNGNDFSANKVDVISSISNAQLIKYGIIPLNILLEDEYEDFKFGSTYLSAFTNFVPRSIWVNKFETGGVAITKFRAGADDYTGTSNYSPGLVGEAILNFGYVFGPVISTGILFVNFLISILFYKKVKLQMAKKFEKAHLFYLFMFLMYLTIPGGLLFGEYSSIYMSLIIKVIFFVIIFFPLIKIMKVYNVNHSY
ncbi:O-antigen polymerase [Shewanella algae]|uniref:O-antigen polymerase n=1 Tax=Shewanella algae TaxID=38313 RepID=UPI0031F4857A